MNNFLLGFGLGVTVAVLFAPKAGGETRQLLTDKAAEGSDYLMQQGQQLKDSATDLVEKGRDALLDQKARIANAVQGAKQGYQA
jgi:gas vesicle protein